MDEQVKRLSTLAEQAVMAAPSRDNVTRLIEPRRSQARGKLIVADAADQYLRVRRLQQDGTPLLRYYKGEWYRYNGTIYVRRDTDEIKADVMRYIRQVDRRHANTGFQTGVLANLQSLCEMPNHIDWPALWTENGWDTRPDLVVVQNGVVDITAAVTGGADTYLMPHTPFFLSMVLLPFAYDLDAVCPRWMVDDVVKALNGCAPQMRTEPG